MWIRPCLALFVWCLQGLDVFLRAGALNQDVDVVYESQSNGSHARACINPQQVSVMERIAVKGKMDDLCAVCQEALISTRYLTHVCVIWEDFKATVNGRLCATHLLRLY